MRLTQAAIAQRLGVGASRVGNWFQGLNFPKEDDARRLAELLGVSVEWLLEGADASVEEFPARTGESAPFLERDPTPASTTRAPPRVILPTGDFSSSLSASPTPEDIKAYLQLVLVAAGRDPQRLGWLLDELRVRLEERRLWWLKNPPASSP